MFKKIILILALICMIVLPSYGVGGTYTDNGYFYLPDYGAYGEAEWTEYNAYMQIADTQIEANKAGIGAEAIQDIAGAMWTGNTETGITLTYQDADGTVDAVIGANDIVESMLKFVNTPNDEEIFTYEATTGDFEWHTLAELSIQPLDTALTNISGLTYISPSFIKLTANDTYTVRTITETVTDLALDSDDLSDVASIAMLNENESITGNWVNTTNPWADNEVANNITIDLATLATTITVTDNESTNEANPICFVAGADPDGGSLGIETDGDLTYNPSTGMVKSTNVFFGSFANAVAPAVTDDIDGGYVIGSFWIDTTGDEMYVCLDNTDGAAVWSKAAPGGGGGSVDTSGTPADNDFAKFTDADTIEGRSYLETRNDLDQYIVYPQPYATGAGTVGDPWAGDCLDDAYTACPTGGTIYLRAGYYELANALAIAKAINIIGEGRGKTFITLGYVNDHGITVNASYVTLKGFTLDADAMTANKACIGLVGGNNYLWFEDLELKNAIYYGLNIIDNSYCTIRDIYAHDNGRHGIHAGASTAGQYVYNTFENIYCWDNTLEGVDVYSTIPGRYNTYNNLNCWSNDADGITIYNENEMTLTNSFSNDNGSDGIYIRDVEDSIISNCVANLNVSNGIYIKTSIKNINLTDIITKNNSVGITLENATNVKLINCHSYDNRTVTGTDIAFVDGGAGEDTITRTAGDFLAEGFAAGKDITITGAGQAGNNDTFAIVSVVAGTINVATASLTTEAAGATVTIVQEKVQTYGLITTGTTDYIELMNCDLRGNLTGRISNGASAKITGKDIHRLIEDHDFSGEWETEKVGESVVFGELLYFNWTDKEWKKTDADAAATMPGLRIALESKADGAECLMLVQGDIRDDSAFAFAGSMVYASCTPGDITSTAPSASGDQVQRVGVAAHADYFYFNPSPDQGEI